MDMPYNCPSMSSPSRHIVDRVVAPVEQNRVPIVVSVHGYQVLDNLAPPPYTFPTVDTLPDANNAHRMMLQNITVPVSNATVFQRMELFLCPHPAADHVHHQRSVRIYHQSHHLLRHRHHPVLRVV